MQNILASRFHAARALAGALFATAALAASLPAAASPAIQHWTAPTGARVYFVESHALPLIDIQIDFAGGSAADPADKAGTASLTRGLLDAGAGELDEQAISDRSADLGIAIGGGVEADRSSLSLRTLSSARERDAGVALAAELLARPRFPAEVLERERARGIAGLKEALTRPGPIAAKQFAQSIYGSHPYGLSTSLESLAAISRADLLAYHGRHYVARNASIAIVGDVDRQTAERIAVSLTEALPAGEPAPPLAPPSQPEAGVLRIPNPSAQAHVLIGQPVLSREDPDYYPLLVGNYVLGGGGFVSRLTREVREKRGYAYSVSSHFMPQQVAGPFQIGLQTRGSQVNDALQVVDQTLADFIADGPTAAELRAAKDNIINGFGLRLDSNRKILGYVAVIGFYRLPLDWLDSYPRHVAEVSAEQIRDAYRRRLEPAHRVAVIVGGDGDRQATPPADSQATPAASDTTPGGLR